MLKDANEFVLQNEIWFKLDVKFPKWPGLYLLYYISEQELYTGSHISGSKHVPVYIGMSTSDISGCLADHRGKIDEAKDLNISDFAVKVMFMDNRHYPPCIEGMFIEYLRSCLEQGDTRTLFWSWRKQFLEKSSYRPGSSKHRKSLGAT